MHRLAPDICYIAPINYYIMAKKSYEIAVGLKKGHKVTKNERKKLRPSKLKGVSIHALIDYIYNFCIIAQCN